MQSKKARTLSKSELLFWLQQNISPQLKNIEDLGTGAEFCLGAEILFPGSIDLEKIKIGEKTEDGRRKNFKQLQNALTKMNVHINIPVENLIKGSFKYNLYFGQWFKNFFEKHYNCRSYGGTKYESNKCHRVESSNLSKKMYKNNCSKNISEDAALDICIAEKMENIPTLSYVSNEPKLNANKLAITYTENSNNPDPESSNSPNKSSNPNMLTTGDTGTGAETEPDDVFQPSNSHVEAEYKSYKFVLRALEKNIQHLQQENKKLREENMQAKEKNQRLLAEIEAYKRIKTECRMMASLLDRFREYH